MIKCPVDDDYDIFEPCPVCGAFGPWFDSGECVGNIVDTGDDLHKILGEALARLPQESASE